MLFVSSRVPVVDLVKTRLYGRNKLHQNLPQSSAAADGDDNGPAAGLRGGSRDGGGTDGVWDEPGEHKVKEAGGGGR